MGNTELSDRRGQPIDASASVARRDAKCRDRLAGRDSSAVKGAVYEKGNGRSPLGQGFQHAETPGQGL